jgi:hypothetical protein
MLSIRDGEALSRALDSPIDDRLKEFLILRRDQLGGEIDDQAHVAVPEPADTLNDIERLLGFPIGGDATAAPEWAEDHGFAYELVYIFTDDGFAHVIIIPCSDQIDRQLLALGAAYASEQV